MIRSLLTALLLSGASVPALALQNVEEQEVYNVILKSRVITEDDQITFGDLFVNAGRHSDVAIARAPEPGQTLSRDPIYIVNEAREHNLFWANPAGMMRVTVERPSQVVSAQALRNLIAESLYMETGDAYEVSLSNSTLSLHAPLNTVGGPQLIEVDHNTYSGMFRATVRAYPGADDVQISGRAFATTDIPVLNRSLNRGDLISASDIEWTQIRADRLPSNVIRNADRLLGQQAQRALRENAPLRNFDVSTPISIRRGEVIPVTYKVGNLVLTAQMRALQDGVAGHQIRFVNLQSNRTIEALVTGTGQAELGPGIYSQGRI